MNEDYKNLRRRRATRDGAGILTDAPLCKRLRRRGISWRRGKRCERLLK